MTRALAALTTTEVLLLGDLARQCLALAFSIRARRREVS